MPENIAINYINTKQAGLKSVSLVSEKGHKAYSGLAFEVELISLVLPARHSRLLIGRVCVHISRYRLPGLEL